MGEKRKRVRSVVIARYIMTAFRARRDNGATSDDEHETPNANEIGDIHRGLFASVLREGLALNQTRSDQIRSLPTQWSSLAY